MLLLPMFQDSHPGTSREDAICNEKPTLFEEHQGKYSSRTITKVFLVAGKLEERGGGRRGEQEVLFLVFLLLGPDASSMRDDDESFAHAHPVMMTAVWH
ncbi:hypothetical protein [Cystobacter ferrugineus]|uniref:hypothetical protein n=1 Tax=Cystobacter ferrugineus TaxID=83449 RepID=UPI0011613C4F|nr:hypothetical protein [Cystobacter ferrugineus]